MSSLVRRLVDLGVTEGRSPAEVRRIQTINLISLGATFFNTLYNLLFAVIGLEDLALVFTTNTMSIVLYIVVLALNHQGRQDPAMYLSFGTGLFNLSFAGYLLGLGTGVYLFLFIIPAAAILVTPRGAIRTQATLSLIGLLATVGVITANPPVPDPIAGTAFEPALLVLSIVGSVAFVTLTAMHFRHVAETAEAELQVAHERSEQLLHNILPVEIADRLKGGEGLIADRADEVSILFADLVGSTPMSERLTADQMVEVLNDIFCPFDDLADELGLEKIKTVGDAYMVVGGLPVRRHDHAAAIAEMALRMREELGRHTVDGFGSLQMRFGIHSGSVVAGVIGKRKFSYDLWGDAVNTAARMESHGVPGEIQVSEDFYRRLEGEYRFVSRGQVDIKGKGPMQTYFLEGRGVP